MSESEVWLLLMVLAEVNASLNRLNKAHRDIRPLNVLYSEDFKQIKFAPIGTFPSDLNALQKRNRGVVTYLAPENQSITNQNSNINWSKNDIYASGLTLLDGMTL